MSTYTIYKNPRGKSSIQNYYESYLKTFEVEFERKRIDTRFGKTHLLATGPQDGKPLMILQGGNCINPMTLSWFSPLLKEYRIYAPDTIGHPGYSAETRVSAKDDSYALWITDLMDHLQLEKSAFIGASYGAGIILRLASYHSERIACSVLVCPAGLWLGSKRKMIQEILLPLLWFKLTSSRHSIQKIADTMSQKSMKEMDRDIIGEIFSHVKLEQDMPKLTEKAELAHFHSPTMLVTGKKDIFFPELELNQKAKDIIPFLATAKTYDMGHFPSEGQLKLINNDIKVFLMENY